ncbi:MAG: DUF1538 domain-containing protein [Rhodospirillales bacterium]|nr:DUF1538 domain-containing protein [Rhodospirillales bacterium]MBT5350887.1 DUF1538 domain-containing protein [Rhodospirillales bacterium]MBT7779655.1 DUF1538 domain-containing protein [Rhodospirillales bacterium]
MAREIRYGDLARELSLEQVSVSYGDLTPAVQYDDAGNVIPHRPENLHLTPTNIQRLLGPYIGVRLGNQVKAVVPLALYLILFQLLILRQAVADSWIITAGLFAVIIGLMLFMEGLKLGLMPFGETIGNNLPKRVTLPVALTVAFLLGISVTFAEPAIGALKAVGMSVDPVRAPYLWALLNQWSGVLVLIVGMGVGLAAVLGTVRFLNGWSLKPYIYLTLGPVLALTFWAMTDAELTKILGLAWDCGAVTTGPVTVPLVLSLGIGIASAGGTGKSSLSGFGIVTLASLFPVLGVMLLSFYLAATITPESIVAAAAVMAVATEGVVPWHETTPFAEVIGGVRAIVPLVLFLLVILKVVLREKIHEAGIVAYGLVLCVLGMIVFNLGLSYGLSKLGGQSGEIIPAAFIQLDYIEDSPLYFYEVGIAIALFFAAALGFGATLAEPALNALGITVENLTNGVFKKRMLLYAVSIGVGFGIATGVLKIIYDLPIGWLLIPGYGLALILTYLASEEFVNVAWDSAGVTTGPITVPLVLAMGLGFGNAVDAVEGFGILSMASVGPILSVLITGVWVQGRARRKRGASEQEPEAT